MVIQTCPADTHYHRILRYDAEGKLLAEFAAVLSAQEAPAGGPVHVKTVFALAAYGLALVLTGAALFVLVVLDLLPGSLGTGQQQPGRDGLRQRADDRQHAVARQRSRDDDLR